ncbi:glucodextranase DOMON-like domain-containing protein [Deinococcus radiotolerans]|uniref:glucodextranase DOMON-like domain-containing protein n=1 Tax=Deinococcus radiotolerans TaxID=1309407 RepID=UPI001E586B15|nr:glucodextranase DOMON-like domain-containing protein [Deinococcus radiotolerans]
MLALLASQTQLTDPSGDARGDGGYVLPTRPAFTPDMLDLRALDVRGTPQGMQFTVTYGQMGNPWNAPGGFSAGVTDIYVKGALGGQTKLGDSGLRTSGGGWQYHLRVSPSGSTLTEVNTQGEERPLAAPTVTVSGTQLVVATALPDGPYGYWVMNSVYSPLTSDGVLRPTTSSGPTALQAGRADAPVPVDVMAASGDQQAYTRGTLAPVGETRDLLGLGLLTLGVVGALLTVIATVFVWRRLSSRTA